MDEKRAQGAFAALSQPTRLAAFRQLVRHGPEGLPQGELADALGMPHNSLSFHLGHLERAGLVTTRRESRRVFYAVDMSRVADLVAFLVEDCCLGTATRSGDGCGVASVLELTVCLPTKSAETSCDDGGCGCEEMHDAE